MKYAVITVGLSLLPIQATAFLDNERCELLVYYIAKEMVTVKRIGKDLKELGGTFPVGNKNTIENEEDKKQLQSFFLEAQAVNEANRYATIYLAGCKN